MSTPIAPPPSVVAAPPTPESAPLARDEDSGSSTPGQSFVDKVTILARITPILLEVFSVVDDVFTESDALSPEKRQVGLSRIYRAYKAAKAQLDPESAS